MGQDNQFKYGHLMKVPSTFVLSVGDMHQISHTVWSEPFVIHYLKVQSNQGLHLVSG